MRAGLILQTRDKESLRFLATGLATADDIFKALFNNGNPKVKTRKRVTMRRLGKLVKDGFILTAVHPMIEDTLYYLTPDGAKIVVSTYGWPIESIWLHYNIHTVFHDFLCSRVAKQIVREATVYKLFDLDYLMLETELKAGAKIKKGSSLEDMVFGITLPAGNLGFSLEGDCDTISKKDFLAKMYYFSTTILVLTTTPKRLYDILRYLKEGGVRKPVYVATFDDFFNSSLLTCLWHTNFSSNLRTIR